MLLCQLRHKSSGEAWKSWKHDLRKSGTPKPLIWYLHLSVKQWTSSKRPIPENFAQEGNTATHLALQEQLAIGWNHFMWGKISTGWETAYMEAWSRQWTPPNRRWSRQIVLANMTLCKNAWLAWCELSFPGGTRALHFRAWLWRLAQALHT